MVPRTDNPVEDHATIKPPLLKVGVEHSKAFILGLIITDFPVNVERRSARKLSHAASWSES